MVKTVQKIKSLIHVMYKHNAKMLNKILAIRIQHHNKKIKYIMTQ